LTVAEGVIITPLAHDGLVVSMNGFGNALTPLFFKNFREIPIDKSGLASLISATWNQPMEWLKRIGTLREFFPTRERDIRQSGARALES
jgi:hypothetical protein